MAIKLYGYWRSSAAYRVRIALNLKDLPYENISISLKPGVAENRGEIYRARNPQMLVPFFEDDEINIGQSMAILEYLDEAYPQVMLLPKSNPDRSRVRAFANVIACDIHPLQNQRVQRFVADQYDGDGVKWAAYWIAEGLKALEALVDDGPFCFGDAPTLADTVLVPQLYNARRFGVDLDDYPKLVAADSRSNELDAFRKAAPENQPDAA